MVVSHVKALGTPLIKQTRELLHKCKTTSYCWQLEKKRDLRIFSASWQEYIISLHNKLLKTPDMIYRMRFAVLLFEAMDGLAIWPFELLQKQHSSAKFCQRHRIWWCQQGGRSAHRRTWNHFAQAVGRSDSWRRPSDNETRCWDWIQPKETSKLPKRNSCFIIL